MVRTVERGTTALSRSRRERASILTSQPSNCLCSQPVSRWPVPLPAVQAALPAGKYYTDQGVRSLLIDIWNGAKGESLLPAGHPKPAEVVKLPSIKVKRARLNLEEF